MNRSINKLVLVGQVGRNPDVETVEGAKVARFPLMTSRQEHDGERYEWHPLVVKGGLAEFAEKVRKGDRLYIEGRLEYDPRHMRNGVTLPVAEIVVREFVVLGATLNKEVDDDAR